MLAWRDDIQNLIDKTGDERNAFVRRTTSHRRSASTGSARSFSSGGGDLDEDEADAVPFSATQSLVGQPHEAEPQSRPSPGGRFPSDIQVDRHLQTTRATSSRSSSEVGLDVTTASGGLQGSYPPYMAADSAHDSVHQGYYNQASADANPYEYNPNRAYQQSAPPPLQQQDSYFEKNPPQHFAQETHQPYDHVPPANTAPEIYQPQPRKNFVPPPEPSDRPLSNYGDWMSPAAGAVGGAAAGALGADAYHRYQQGQQQQQPGEEQQRNFQPPDIPTGTQPVPERHPDHTVPANPTGALAPNAVATGQENHIAPPLPVQNVGDQPFLGGAEVPPTASTSGPAINNVNLNGGPVLVPGTRQVVEDVPAPVKRTNTDFSVSELHVPGEYPKGAAGGSAIS